MAKVKFEFGAISLEAELLSTPTAEAIKNALPIEARAFFKVWLGRMPRRDAERRGLLRIEGPRPLLRAFPGWFDWPALPPAASRAERLGRSA